MDDFLDFLMMDEFNPTDFTGSFMDSFSPDVQTFPDLGGLAQPGGSPIEDWYTNYGSNFVNPNGSPIDDFYNTYNSNFPMPGGSPIDDFYDSPTGSNLNIGGLSNLLGPASQVLNRGTGQSGNTQGRSNVPIPNIGGGGGGNGAGGYGLDSVISSALGGGGGGLGSGALNGLVDGSLLQLLLGGAGAALAWNDSDRMLNKVEENRDTLDPFGSQRAGYQDLMRRYYADPAAVIGELPGYKAAMNLAERELTERASSKGLLNSGKLPTWMIDRAAETAARFSDQYEDNIRDLTGAQFGPNSYASALMTALAAEQSGRNAAYDMLGQGLSGLAGRSGGTNININNGGSGSRPGGASGIPTGVLSNNALSQAYMDYLRQNGINPDNFFGGGDGNMPIESADGTGNNAAGGGGTGGAPDPTDGFGGPGDDGSFWAGAGTYLPNSAPVFADPNIYNQNYGALHG